MLESYSNGLLSPPTDARSQALRPSWLSGRAAIALPLLVGFLCFAIAFWQPFGTPPDFYEYDLFLHSLRDGGLAFLAETRFEPAFVVFSYGLTLLTESNLLVVASIAFISAVVKMAAVRAVARGPVAAAIAAALYVVRFGPLHELAQLRISLALALVLWVFVLRWSGRVRLAVAASGGAVLMHYSTAFLLPILALDIRRRRTLLLFAVVEIAAVRLLMPLLVESFAEKVTAVSMYQAAGHAAPNALALAVLLDIAMVGACLFFWDNMTPPMRQALVMAVAGLVFYYSALDFSVFASRIREAMSVFWVFFVAEALGGHRHLRALSASFVLACLVGYTYVYFFLGGGFFFR